MPPKMRNHNQQFDFTPQDWSNLSFFSPPRDRKQTFTFNTQDVIKAIKAACREMQEGPWSRNSNPWL